jgi:hypothetical protein
MYNLQSCKLFSEGQHVFAHLVFPSENNEPIVARFMRKPEAMSD